MKTKFTNFTICFALLIASTSIYANEETLQLTPKSRQLLQSLKNDVRESLSLIADTQSQPLDQFQYSQELPEAHYVNLGLIQELNNSQSAMVVISVTPGSLAAVYGLDAGDEIKSVDGIDVSATTENTILRKLQNLSMGDKLLLGVRRQGVLREIVIPLTATFVPQVELEIGYGLAKQNSLTPATELSSTACGEVSVLPSPSENGELYPVSIDRLGGKDTLATGNQARYKLLVGKQIVYVKKQIDSDSAAQGKEQKGQAIEINVRANTSYHLAAKSSSGKYTETPNGANWEAVIWKTSQQACQL